MKSEFRLIYSPNQPRGQEDPHTWGPNEWNFLHLLLPPINHNIANQISKTISFHNLKEK